MATRRAKKRAATADRHGKRISFRLPEEWGVVVDGLADVLNAGSGARLICDLLKDRHAELTTRGVVLPPLPPPPLRSGRPRAGR
jgi:hypothetical protein